MTGKKEHGSGDAPRCLPCETGHDILRAVEDRGGALSDTGFAAPVVCPVPCLVSRHKQVELRFRLRRQSTTRHGEL